MTSALQLLTSNFMSERAQGIAVIVLAIGAVALTALGSRMSIPGTRSSQTLESVAEAAVGTTGVHPTANAVRFRPGLPTIHELETITGVNDGHLLVGRRADLHVPVQQSINDSVFWVGSKDNRLLVVVRPRRNPRPQRDGTATSNGHGGTVQAGERATVVGSIQRIPDDEAMSSWGLTDADLAESMERRIYLRAESISVLP